MVPRPARGAPLPFHSDPSQLRPPRGAEVPRFQIYFSQNYPKRGSIARRTLLPSRNRAGISAFPRDASLTPFARVRLRFRQAGGKTGIRYSAANQSTKRKRDRLRCKILQSHGAPLKIPFYKICYGGSRKTKSARALSSSFRSPSSVPRVFLPTLSKRSANGPRSEEKQRIKGNESSSTRLQFYLQP